MAKLLEPVLVIALLLNFAALGTSRLRALIRAVALQGGLLGIAPLLVTSHEHGARLYLLCAATITLKGLVIPAMLLRAMREVRISREVEPFVGYVTSLLLAAAGTGLSVIFAGTLPLLPEHAHLLLVPASASTALCGFLILMTRRKAITQVCGYLMLENGIFIFGLLLLDSVPFMVELGVLLDLFVGVFVMGIIINHINREFASMDTRHLTALKE